MTTQSIRGTNAFRLIGLLTFTILGCSCGNSADLDRSKATAVLERDPVTLEQYPIRPGNDIVAVSDAQLDCAVKAGLFQIGASGEYPATEKGESLGYRHSEKFEASNPATAGWVTKDPDLLGHWVLSLSNDTKVKVIVESITGITDGRQPGTKLVTAKVRVKLPDACFTEPLRIWRVGAGENADPALPFDFRRFDDGWRLAQ